MAEDDDIYLDDMATLIREFALQASEIGDDKFKALETWNDLPLAPKMEGGQWSRRVFRENVDPHRLSDAADIAIAQPKDPGIDIVRFDYVTEKGPLRVYEGASFYLLLPVAMISAEWALKLEAPIELGPPDEKGWHSTNAETRLDDCEDWKDRVDAISVGDALALLVFKIELRSRQFHPNALWF